MLQSQITRSTWLVLSACNASGALLAVSASWPKRASAFVSTPRTDGSWSTRRTVAIVVGLTIELDRSYAKAGIRISQYGECSVFAHSCGRRTKAERANPFDFLLKQARHRPDKRIERELFPRHSLGLFVRELALTFAEEGGAHPRARARIAPPVRVVLLDEGLGDERLELPGAEVARSVEPGIDVNEGVGRTVAEARCSR